MTALLKVHRAHCIRLPNIVLQLCFPQEDGVVNAKGSEWSHVLSEALVPPTSTSICGEVEKVRQTQAGPPDCSPVSTLPTLTLTLSKALPILPASPWVVGTCGTGGFEGHFHIQASYPSLDLLLEQQI